LPRRELPDDDVLGRGRYLDLSPELDGPTRWGRDATRFGEALYRSCGARLAWHRRRKVYVVYKRRQHGNRPLVPIRDLDRSKSPLNTMLVRLVSAHVKLIEAQLGKDIGREIDLYRRQDRDRRNEAYQRHMDEIMPELHKMQVDALRVMSDGRFRPRIFDMGVRQKG